MISKSEFFDMVWSKPLFRLSAELTITASVLRQICFDLNIPVPEGYYWSRDNYGSSHYQPPALSDGELLFDLTAAAASAKAKLRYPGESKQTFKISSKLDNPDPLIIAAQNTIVQDYNLYGMPEMLKAGHGEIAIRASKANMNRAMRIMDTLVKCWRGRNYVIKIQQKETSVIVREVWFRVSLREVTKKLPKKGRYDLQQYESTGRLALRVDGHLDQEWRDGKQQLENYIEEIADQMEIAARDLEKIWAVNAAKRAEEEEAQGIKDEQVRNTEAERHAFESLIVEAQRWQQLRTLDEYLEELYKVKKHTPAFMEWYRWAKERRKIFDPIHSSNYGSNDN